MEIDQANAITADNLAADDRFWMWDKSAGTGDDSLYALTPGVMKTWLEENMAGAHDALWLHPTVWTEGQHFSTTGDDGELKRIYNEQNPRWVWEIASDTTILMLDHEVYIPAGPTGEVEHCYAYYALPGHTTSTDAFINMEKLNIVGHSYLPLAENPYASTNTVTLSSDTADQVERIEMPLDSYAFTQNGWSDGGLLAETMYRLSFGLYGPNPTYPVHFLGLMLEY